MRAMLYVNLHGNDRHQALAVSVLTGSTVQGPSERWTGQEVKRRRAIRGVEFGPHRIHRRVIESGCRPIDASAS